MLKKLLNHECTILREVKAGKDKYGNDVRTWQNVDAKTWPCRLETWRGKEMEIDRDTRVTLFRLYLPQEAFGHVDSLCRIEMVDDAAERPDVQYQVWGTPQLFYRRVQPNHVECILRRIIA